MRGFIKKIVILSVIILIFIVNASAEESSNFTTDYDDQFKASGAETLEDNLPDYAKELLMEWELNPSDPNGFTSFDEKNILEKVLASIMDSVTAPFTACILIITIILLCSILEATGSSINKPLEGLYSYFCTLSICSCILIPLSKSIYRASTAIEYCGIFIMAFIPVYVAIIISSGKLVTALSYQTLVFSAAQIITRIASSFITPITGMLLALSVSGSISPNLNLKPLIQVVQKTITWILTFGMTIFVAMISIKGVVSAATDSVTLRTGKFIVGNSVPIIGSALAEALSTVQSCIGLLRASVGAYGVIACLIILLPAFLEIVMYKLILNISSAVADIFSLYNISNLLKSASNVIGILIAIMSCCALMFIFSLTVMLVSSKVV